MIKVKYSQKAAIAATLLLLALSGSCATTSKLGAVASVAHTLALPPSSTGYDWAKILPAAPVLGSEQDVFDMAAVRGGQSLIGSPRWELAKRDASLNTFDMFGAVLGDDFTVAKRPEIGALTAYVGRRFSIASNESKAIFARPRPFITAPNLTICTDEKPGGFSYPSGHSGWGWISAQVLARVEPKYASALLSRGFDYGQSRMICGVHYPSDVVAGRILADAVLVHLDNDPEYLRLLASAKSAVK
jgi:acid phosphatase (class A)